jgi:hypothetical protein
MPEVEEFTDEQISEAMARGDELFFELKDGIEDAEDDPIGVAYSLWVALTRYLASAGWTEQELAKDAMHHAADQTSEGNG